MLNLSIIQNISKDIWRVNMFLLLVLLVIFLIQLHCFTVTSYLTKNYFNYILVHLCCNYKKNFN